MTDILFDSVWGVLGLALAYIAAPIVLGVAAGQLLTTLRKGTPLRSWLAVGALSVAPILVALGLPYRWVPLHISDRLMLSLLFAAGMLLRGHARGRAVERRSIALLIGSLIIALLAAEGAVHLLPPPPLFPSTRHVSLLLPREHKRRPDFIGEVEPGLQADVLYPQNAADGPLPDLSECRQSDDACILHVGDSMAWAIGVRRSKTFPAILDRFESAQSHINASAPGIGPDGYYVLTMNWLERIQPDLVVVHFFLGNDGSFGEPVHYCMDQPLLSESHGALVLNCDETQWSEEGKRSKIRGPKRDVPYPVRILTTHSVLARHLRALAHRKKKKNHKEEHGQAHRCYERQLAYRYIERIVTTIHQRLEERGIALVISILPYRVILEHSLLPEPRPDLKTYEDIQGQQALTFKPLKDIATLRDHILDVCEQFHIPYWDHTDMLLQALSGPDGRKIWVNNPPGDHHFSVYGHSLLAERMQPLINGILEKRTGGQR